MTDENTPSDRDLLESEKIYTNTLGRIVEEAFLATKIKNELIEKFDPELRASLKSARDAMSGIASIDIETFMMRNLHKQAKAIAAAMENLAEAISLNRKL